MNNKQLLSQAKRTVSRLVMQYSEYMEVMNQISALEDEKLHLALKLSKEHNSTVSSVLSQSDMYEEIGALHNEIELLQLDLQQISDEMTFSNPIVWMMYKYEAYQGQPNELSTMGQFRTHCAPQGYICTERYIAVHSYLKDKYGVDINDPCTYSDEHPLYELYSSDLLLQLASDLEFMKLWKDHEYLKTDARVNKWRTVIS